MVREKPWLPYINLGDTMTIGSKIQYFLKDGKGEGKIIAINPPLIPGEPPTFMIRDPQGYEFNVSMEAVIPVVEQMELF